MDLAKRFSLDHLVSGASQAAQRAGPVENPGTRPFEEAVTALVSPVLKNLEGAPNNAQRLFPLFDAIRAYVPLSDIWQFREVIQFMQDRLRLIRIVEKDSHGNDLVQKV